MAAVRASIDLATGVRGLIRVGSGEIPDTGAPARAKTDGRRAGKRTHGGNLAQLYTEYITERTAAEMSVRHAMLALLSEGPK
jgi:hypothetical protein